MAMPWQSLAISSHCEIWSYRIENVKTNFWWFQVILHHSYDLIQNTWVDHAGSFNALSVNKQIDSLMEIGSS